MQYLNTSSKTTAAAAVEVPNTKKKGLGIAVLAYSDPGTAFPWASGRKLPTFK